VRVYVEVYEPTYMNHSAGCHGKPSITVDVTGYSEVGMQKAVSYASSLMKGKVYSLQVRYCHREPNGMCYTIVLG
jgi:hypothetical protein